MIIRLTGSRSDITFETLPMDDPKRRQPDISLAKKALNWKPSTDIEKGLERTIEYFRGLITE
jgi:UDP-glucuronate decarboxylase